MFQYSLCDKNQKLIKTVEFDTQVHHDHVIAELRQKANTGFQILGKHSFVPSWGTPLVGFYFGRHKNFLSRSELLIGGSNLWSKPSKWVAKWIPLTCDEIGAQSSIAYLKSAAIKLSFGTFKQQHPNLMFEHYEFYMEKIIQDEYQNVLLARSKWKKKNNVEFDCRTYAGQPDRNMVRRLAA